MWKFAMSIMLVLAYPLSVAADGMLTRAANPPQPINLLGASAIPMIKAPSGSMGNNGAVSGLTALPKTYSSGAYLYLPAGAVAAGVPAAAAWYCFVGSSTTAGTVYNLIYTSGIPQPCNSSAPAFVTTGPGAFTGATGLVTAITIMIPANIMGRQGKVKAEYSFSFNNTAGNKINAVKFGAGTCFTNVNTTQLSFVGHCYITNRGTTAQQHVTSFYASAAGGVLSTSTAADLTVATTADVLLTLTYDVAVATDYSIVEGFDVTALTWN